MSCNCTSTNALPKVADDLALHQTVESCATCPQDDSCLNSCQSEGTELPSSWLDAGCRNQDLTILARYGSKLSRFSGSGFIKLVNGVASVVTSVPLKAATLWHRWWKPTAASTPIVGEPLAYPYQVIADPTGELHAIKGHAEEDSVSFWDASDKEFTQKPESELPKAQKGLLPRETEVELIGYVPIADDGDADTVRPLSSLEGSGLVYLEQQATVASPSNPCGAALASVAKSLTLPTPAADETYTLKYSTALGLHWSADA